MHMYSILHSLEIDIYIYMYDCLYLAMSKSSTK